MNIISFAWTTDALLAGAKTCTRREWTDDFAKRFHAGDLVAAYNRNPRNGGKQIATIRLTRDPYPEFLADAPEDDYAAEGLAWMERQGLLVPVGGKRIVPSRFWELWKWNNPLVWVVRFELVTAHGKS